MLPLVCYKIFLPQDWVPAAASADAEKVDDTTDEFGAKDFRKDMNLRTDHEVRYMYVSPSVCPSEA